jgi:hypothetical protein
VWISDEVQSAYRARTHDIAQKLVNWIAGDITAHLLGELVKSDSDEHLLPNLINRLEPMVKDRLRLLLSRIEQVIEHVPNAFQKDEI